QESSGVCCPYWGGAALRALVPTLVAGAPLPNGIDPALARALRRAGVVAPAQAFAAARDRRAAAVAEGRAAVAPAGDPPLRGLRPPLQLAAVRRYYRALREEGFLEIGIEPDGARRRYGAHNEPLARLFHIQFAQLVSSVVGQPLKPSYVFLTSYVPG